MRVRAFLWVCVNSVWILILYPLLTFGRHGSLCSDDVGVASELLQRRDGALTHHGLPAKWTVVDHLQHNGRCVHLILWKELEV